MISLKKLLILEITNADLGQSASEEELRADHIPRSSARLGSTEDIPSQHESVHIGENATPASNEDTGGVLKLPIPFKLDFVW